MNETHKMTLLAIAKRTVAAVIAGKPVPKGGCDDAVLNEPRGCFVTLKNGDELRGCIGQFEAELPELFIEISALTPMQKTDDPMSLRLGIDGIYITDGVRSGCFLPQVADETGWDTEEFLGYCCTHKAGLPWDAWKKKGVEVYLFSAEVFGAPWDQIRVES